MPLKFDDITNSFKETAFKNKFIGSFIKNPFYTAILITFLIVLTILFVFRNVDLEDNSLMVLSFRTGIYLLLIITGIQFLQNKYIMEELSSKKDITGGLFEKTESFDDVPIKPDLPNAPQQQEYRNVAQYEDPIPSTSFNQEFVPIVNQVNFIS